MNEDVKTEVPLSEESTTTEEVTEVVPESPKPGEKTDSALLLESLHNERDKRREADAEIARLKALTQAQSEPEVFSDEGKALQQRIDSLKDELALKDATIQYPALKDAAGEFKEFRSSYPGVSIESVAKLFLSEKGLLETPKPRKGLEKNTGGGQVQPKQGLTPQEVDDLRTNNYRKYSDMVRKGEIKV